MAEMTLAEGRKLARSMQKALKARGTNVSFGEMLLCLAQTQGFKDWNAWCASSACVKRLRSPGPARTLAHVDYLRVSAVDIDGIRFDVVMVDSDLCDLLRAAPSTGSRENDVVLALEPQDAKLDSQAQEFTLAQLRTFAWSRSDNCYKGLEGVHLQFLAEDTP